MAKGRSSRRPSRTRPLRYAQEIVQRLGGRTTSLVHSAGEGWWTDSFVFSVPYHGKNFWIRIGTDPSGEAVSYVVGKRPEEAHLIWSDTLQRAVPSRDALFEAEGQRPWPSALVLASTLRALLRRTLGRRSSRPTSRTSRRLRKTSGHSHARA
jgi:hypothetical protein